MYIIIIINISRIISIWSDTLYFLSVGQLIRVVNLKPQDREFSGSFSSQDSRSSSLAQAIRVPVIIDTITEKSHNRSQDQQLRNA